MKKLSVCFLWLSLLSLSVSAQCTSETVELDDFEYNTNIPGLISGTVYHMSPKSYSVAHSPTRYCYMNFVNNISVNTLVMNRTYNLCVNSEYRFSAWFNEINGGTSSYKLQVKDANDSILVSSSHTNNTSSWVQWSSSDFSATTSTVKFQLIYTGGTGNNDLALDDLKLERCMIDPFENDSIKVCNSSTINLIDSISLPNGWGGTWTGPSDLVNDSLGTFVADSMLAGQYTYSITSNTACPDSIGLITVNITTVDASVSVMNYSLTAGAANATYQWIDCVNNQAIAGETTQTFTASENGSYAVVVTQNACSDTSACYVIQGIGMAEEMLPGLKYHPNPTNGELQIVLGKEYNKVSLIVMNNVGQIVDQSQSKNVNELQLDLSFLSPGIYYLRIQADGQERVLKIIRAE